MDCRAERVALARIDAHDDTYRITTPQDKPPLEMSIRRLGLIAPVVVQQAAGRTLMIVSGFRRIDACRELGVAEVPCHVLPRDAPAAHCVEIAIADNLTQRPLNLVEQARCLKLLQGDWIEAPAAKQMAETLGIPTNKALAAKLNRLAVTPEAVQDALVRGKISLPTVLLLADLAPEDAELLVALFERLPMGLNKQREVLHLVKEIAAREEVSFAHLLSDGVLKKMLDDDHPDGNLKTRRIRSYLRQRRYPQLSAVEKAFDDCVGEMKLGPRMHIAPPPGFEGRTCTLTLQFSNPQQFATAIHKLSTIVGHTALDNLFDGL